MAKYEALETYLKTLDRSADHRLTFGEIEHVLGFALPASARAHPAWWANQRGAGHSQSHSWMGAGWHSGNVDLSAGEVTFKPVALAREPKLPRARPSAVRPLTVDQAKAGIALKLGISAAAIDIIIRA